MPHVHFTPHLRRHLQCNDLVTSAYSLDAVLKHCFQSIPALKHYVMDDNGHIRQHIAVFIDGSLVKSRTNLKVALNHDSEIYIMQALSGG